MNEEHNDLMELTTQVFHAIEGAQSKIDLIERVGALGLSCRSRSEDQSYPSIPFQLKPNEIDIISSDSNVEQLIKLGHKKEATGLEKLLLAMAWKQNDLKKLGGIVRGIQSVKDDPKGQLLPEKSMVFYFFGRHLVDPINNPIIDQHVIRAFAIKTTTGAAQLKWMSRSNITGTKNDKEMVGDYLKWYSELVRKKGLKNTQENNDFLAEIDFVLMQLGREIKR